MSAETTYDLVARVADERHVSFSEAIILLHSEGALTDEERDWLRAAPRPGGKRSRAPDGRRADHARPAAQRPGSDRVTSYAAMKGLTVYEAAEALYFYGNLERAVYERYRQQAIEAGAGYEIPPSVDEVAAGRKVPIDWSERWPPHPEYPAEFAARQRGEEPPDEPEKPYLSIDDLTPELRSEVRAAAKARAAGRPKPRPSPRPPSDPTSKSNQ